MEILCCYRCRRCRRSHHRRRLCYCCCITVITTTATATINMALNGMIYKEGRRQRAHTISERVARLKPAALSFIVSFFFSSRRSAHHHSSFSTGFYCVYHCIILANQFFPTHLNFPIFPHTIISSHS